MKEYLFITWTPNGLSVDRVRPNSFVDHVSQLFVNGDLATMLDFYDINVGWGDDVKVHNRFGQEVYVIKVGSG